MRRRSWIARKTLRLGLTLSLKPCLNLFKRNNGSKPFTFDHLLFFFVLYLAVRHKTVVLVSRYLNIDVNIVTIKQ